MQQGMQTEEVQVSTDALHVHTALLVSGLPEPPQPATALETVNGRRSLRPLFAGQDVMGNV